MTHISFLRTVLGATVLAGAGASQAATVQLNAWEYGKDAGRKVLVSTPATSEMVYAGGFAGKLNGDALLSYCVELTQSFSWGTVYTDFIDRAAASYFGQADNKADKLGRLLSYVADEGKVGTAAQSASMQLAVWNIVYDTDFTLAAHSGATFSVPASKTASYAVDAAYASELLAASVNWSNTMNVWVLASPTAQDQLHWARAPQVTRNAAEVPEPASLALALLGIVAAGAATRRRAAKA